jgi:hypothetical protein
LRSKKVSHFNIARFVQQKHLAVSQTCVCRS